jgi:two-component system phosphate regulon sensor histidine kinase PhoR
VAAVLIVAVSLALFLAWTETSLRPDLERRAARQLARTLALMADEVGDAPLTDSLAGRFGAAVGLRVTFVGPDGTVLGDSDVATGRLPDLDDHGDRPEILAARADGLGYARRVSRSVALPLFYVAIPHGENVIRAAIPESDVLAILGRTRRTAVLFGGMALLLLLVVSRPVGRSSARDAAELRATARALESREGRTTAQLARLEAMLDAIEDGVAVCDPDGRVVRANRAFERWTGRRELVGQPVATLFRHPGPRDSVDTALDGQAVQVEAVLGTRTARVHAAPFEEGALLILRDLTATRRLESMRRDFVANVSHELKTPMTAIRGFTEPLLDGGVEESQAREFLFRILANLDRMQLLVDDLLDLARIESGGWTPDFQEVEMPAVVRRVWRRMEALANSHSIGLRINAVTSEDRVLADPEAIEQIMANLLDNAIRYSPDEGTVVVTVRSARDGDVVRTEVTDTGPGIPSEHVDRVFERFYRADAGRSRAAGGTGLGLSIVKHLVGAHGGTVGIESELGHGTTVWLELPGVGPRAGGEEAGGEGSGGERTD